MGRTWPHLYQRTSARHLPRASTSHVDATAPHKPEREVELMVFFREGNQGLREIAELENNLAWEPLLSNFQCLALSQAAPENTLLIQGGKQTRSPPQRGTVGSNLGCLTLGLMLLFFSQALPPPCQGRPFAEALPIWETPLIAEFVPPALVCLQSVY